MATMQEAVRRLRIEATTQGVNEAERKVRGLAEGTRSVTVASQGNERATVSMERRLESIRRQYDRNYRAQQTLARVERDLTRARQQGLITLQQQSALMDRAAASVNRYTAASTRSRFAVPAGVQNLAAGFGVIGGAAGIALATRGVIDYGDAWTRTQNQLKVAGLEGERLDQTMDRLFRSAQDNKAPLEALVTLYGRSALVQKELNASSEQMLVFTDRVAQGLRISGKSAEESSGALLQLSQALGSGIVRAEEFNSILEGALPIAQAAARGIDGAGGSVAKLRQMIVDGDVTSREFFIGIMKGSEGFRQQIDGMKTTTEQGFSIIDNSAIQLIGKLTSVTGVAEGTARQLESIASGMDAISKRVDAIEPFIQQMERLGVLPSSVFDALAFVQNPFGAVVSGIGRRSTSKLFGGGVTPSVSATGEGSAAGLSGEVSGEFDLEKAVKDRDKAREKAEKQYDRATGALERQIEAMRIEAATFGMTEAAAARYRVEQQLLYDAKEAGIALSAEERLRVSALAEAYAEQVAQIEQMQERYRTLEDVANTVTGNMGRAFDDFLENGRINFRGFVDDLLKDLARLALQKTLLEPLAEGLSGSLGDLFGGGVDAAVLHEGGYAGFGGRSRFVHPAYFEDAPRYHNGGIAGLRPNEVPAILERGEPVGAMAGRGNVVVTTSVSVSVDASGSDASEPSDREALAKTVGDMVEVKVNAAIAKNLRLGGMLNKTF